MESGNVIECNTNNRREKKEKKFQPNRATLGAITNYTETHVRENAGSIAQGVIFEPRFQVKISGSSFVGCMRPAAVPPPAACASAIVLASSLQDFVIIPIIILFPPPLKAFSSSQNTKFNSTSAESKAHLSHAQHDRPRVVSQASLVSGIQDFSKQADPKVSFMFLAKGSYPWQAPLLEKFF
ncbi:hypothetical protein ACSQ67_023403 [Phaseolus vulgaris]